MLCNGFILKYYPGVAEKTLADIHAKAKARQEQQNPPKRKVAEEKVHTPAPAPAESRGCQMEATCFQGGLGVSKAT